MEMDANKRSKKMKRTLNYALLATAVASAPVALAEESDCYKVSEAVTKSASGMSV